MLAKFSLQADKGQMSASPGRASACPAIGGRGPALQATDAQHCPPLRIRCRYYPWPCSSATMFCISLVFGLPGLLQWSLMLECSHQRWGFEAYHTGSKPTEIQKLSL